LQNPTTFAGMRPILEKWAVGTSTELFFFDVHPPLGKMLIGLSGYLTGYDGTFAFDKPGDKYENTRYVGMRVFCTALGASLVPMSFLAVDEMTQSITAATFASLLILFDVGILTLTQYILLDPILLCFIMGSVLGAVKVSSTRLAEFSTPWWLWLGFTGTMLACCISVKFVGLFVVLLVGLMTIADLWNILGDMSRPVVSRREPNSANIFPTTITNLHGLRLGF
jgi:dolichyl-phosphate-mannose-protein mannosyltransferase